LAPTHFLWDIWCFVANGVFIGSSAAWDSIKFRQWKSGVICQLKNADPLNSGRWVYNTVESYQLTNPNIVIKI
jgi:hypothetical protein